MGLLRLLICGSGHPTIKIMTPHGQCTKCEPPLSVKEALVDYPNHAVFHSDAVRKMGRWARPMEETTSLVPRQLYFLIPLPESSTTRRRPYSDENADRPAVTKQGSTGSRHVSFARNPSYIDSGDTEQKLRPSLEVLPTEDGVVRLKVLMSKKQLAEMMTEGSDALSMVESLVTPLLTEARARSESLPSREDSFTWRPSLESIPEK